jgi:hypothetical protein
MPTLKNDVSGSSQTAIVGTSKQHHGIAGESKASGAGVVGVSRGGDGVSGFSKKGYGIVGQSDESTGVRGLSKAARGVEGLSEKADAIVGISDSGNGVSGSSNSGHGVVGQSESASGLRGVSKFGRGIEGWSESAYGVSGDSARSAGVRGTSLDGRGVEGWSTRSEGVFGICESGIGVSGVAGRSRIHGRLPSDSLDASSVFRIGGAAKQFAAESSSSEGSPARIAAEPTEARDVDSERERASVQPEHAAAHELVEAPVHSERLVSDAIDLAVSVPDVFDDAAGIGVCGEHRGAGIGVKAVSNAGIGVAAYSQQYEAIHAETHSPNTAAIAAYNLNPRGGGAAIFAKKVGAFGHAGFFDGRVWVSGELAVGGDIVLANADCAEDFDVTSMSAAEPGTVMVAGEAGVLQPCAGAYDKCVVGVISGAGLYKPGLILDKQPARENRQPVALLGKVYCKVSAEYGAIEVGDLLTTSPVSGHAMKASDPQRGFGSVIGKALSSWHEGRGLIPILVALQ